MKLLRDEAMGTESQQIDCAANPGNSLTEMFVGMVQAGRIKKGQCPARRPVFLKPHGVVHCGFRIRPDVPADLRVGLFAGAEYSGWVRFSSDTVPASNDFKTTVGIGIKLFGVPGKKVFGQKDDTTFDFILQNHDVFFVDTAKDMCEFTKAGVVDGNYDPYLEAHPKTAAILDAMAKPVGSVLASPYWSLMAFSFGPERFGKYKLEPTITVPPPENMPADPTYLAADLEHRLNEGEVSFRFMVQLRTDPSTMPLDESTVAWSEIASPPIHVADLVLYKQNIRSRGQAEYGENLSWNIWRVTADHTPQGSIAVARREVYAASSQLRRDVNGVPAGEPEQSKKDDGVIPCVDDFIVKAAIHPGIGIARIGDSKTEFFIGPEVTEPAPEGPGFYRDSSGALKRQAARFRIYGLNAAGQVVRELTTNNANIKWTAHLANKKAQWYQFQAALDIPDAVDMSVPRRNPDIPFAGRSVLAIDPGPRSITGPSVSGGPEHAFDTGKFKDTVVPLGEIQTDDAGRLLVLGGTGESASPSGAPVYNPADPNSFNNANDWYDDTSDGPVTAEVTIAGRAIPVDPAWVVVAPPNYAPDIVGWRTMHELLVDVYTAAGWIPVPERVSFSTHVLPVLRRLSNLQWVNKGFAAMFGAGGPMNFEDPAFIEKLAYTEGPNKPLDPYKELRQTLLNAFRPQNTKTSDPRTWPWIYGDAFGSFSASSPLNDLALPDLQAYFLKHWVDGNFINDWNSAAKPPRTLDQVPLSGRPAMLDAAALHFCLADAFHPGCEMTWPVRHSSMYTAPFRIRHRPASDPEPNYGKELNAQNVEQPNGPLYAQSPGDITRWMAVPWQGDTAFCRSGYDPEYDPYLPMFWAARVPNQVLTEDDYKIVIDTSRPLQERIVALNRRVQWLRSLTGSVAQQMMQMIAEFGKMGIVEARPGVTGDPLFPETLYVETLTHERFEALRAHAAKMLAEAPPAPESRVQQAGWESEEQLAEFRSVRVRHRS
jgi:hypothetical protein